MKPKINSKSKFASKIIKLSSRKLLAYLGCLVVGGLFSIYLSTVVLAWDAGNPHRQCMTSECTGGVVKPQLGFLDVLVGWFSMSRVADCPAGYTNNGLTCGRGAHTISAPSRVADCPAGYTNMGLTCFRGAHTYGNRCKGNCRPGYTNNGCTCGRGASTLGASSMVCPTGYHKSDITKRCIKDCPAGYTNTGETCFRPASTLPMSSMSCRPGEVGDSGRCIPVPNIKLRGNTHLWVVNRALELLAKSSDPVAVTAVKKMNESACRVQWQEGLYNEDEPGNADDPTKLNLTAGTHFYNPSGRDAFGNRTSATTYLVGGVDVSTGGLQGRRNLNARQAADRDIRDLSSNPTSMHWCYTLGRALHYMTDMTQPMHTASFSGVSSPMWLHPYFEAYVPFIQDKFPANGSWNERWKGESPDDTFHKTAVQSNAMAPPLMKVLTVSGRKCTIGGLDLSPLPYAGYCFINDPNVHAQTGVVLQEAYQSTASYIYNVFNRGG